MRYVASNEKVFDDEDIKNVIEFYRKKFPEYGYLLVRDIVGKEFGITKDDVDNIIYVYRLES